MVVVAARCSAPAELLVTALSGVQLAVDVAVLFVVTVADAAVSVVEAASDDVDDSVVIVADLNDDVDVDVEVEEIVALDARFT